VAEKPCYGGVFLWPKLFAEVTLPQKL